MPALKTLIFLQLSSRTALPSLHCHSKRIHQSLFIYSKNDQADQQKVRPCGADFLTSVIAWVSCPASIKSSTFTGIKWLLLTRFKGSPSLAVVSHPPVLTGTRLFLLHSISLDSLAVILHSMTSHSIAIALKFMAITTEPIMVITV
jgi:hypothetical protein